MLNYGEADDNRKTRRWLLQETLGFHCPLGFGGLSEAWLGAITCERGEERGEEILPHEAFEGRMY